MMGTDHCAGRENDDLIERGLRAWTNGDLDALEQMVDPAVTLGWIEAGGWDRVGRERVLRLPRQRAADGRANAPRRVVTCR